jgi:hypothetical protein
MAVAGGIEVPITLGGVREVRQQIKQLRGELINATDPTEVARLSENIGQLSDQLKDANEKANVFASGSKFEQAGNALGLMRGQIASLDFEGAGESASLFANRIRAINPAEFGTQIKGLISVVGNLGKAFLSMGASLLMNPIFLIAVAIVAIIAAVGALLNKLGILKPALKAIGAVFEVIGDAINWVIDKIKEFLDWLEISNFAEQEAAQKAAEAAEKRADAWVKFSEERTRVIDQQIRMDKLDNKNTTELELKKQWLIRQTALERIKALAARLKEKITSGNIDAEEIKELTKQYEEQKKIIQQSKDDAAYIRKQDAKQRQDDEKKASETSIKNTQDEAKKRADANKKYKEDRIAVEREIQDLIIQAMPEGEAKERAAIEQKYARQIEDVKKNEKYLKDERTKIINLLNQEQQAELKAIDDKKHEEELERKRQQQIELAKVESDEKANLMQQIEAIENAQEDATLSKQDREINAVRDKYFTLIEEAKKHGLDTVAIEEQMNAEIAKIKTDQAEKDKAEQKKLNEDRLNAVKGGLVAIGSLAEAWAGKDKERQKKAFQINKAMNIATATIDTYKGATAAYASAGGNPILGSIMAAIVVASGLANIAKIKATQFEGGGTSAPTSTASSATATPTAMQPTFSFQGGGNNANSLNSQNDLSMITVKAVVSESEVTSTQNQVSKYENSAKL